MKYCTGMFSRWSAYSCFWKRSLPIFSVLLLVSVLVEGNIEFLNIFTVSSREFCRYCSNPSGIIFIGLMVAEKLAAKRFHLLPGYMKVINVFCGLERRYVVAGVVLSGDVSWPGGDM